MAAQVNHINVNASRKIRVGMGEEYIVGGSWGATADPTLDQTPEEQTNDLLEKLLKGINVVADRINREITTVG